MLTIKQGDIIKEANEVDAIVNAANEGLWRGGGVCGYIFQAAGRELDKECSSIGHCDTGNAVITGAYNLPCKYVIHAVGPVYNAENKEECKDLLYQAYINAIKRGQEKGVHSIAFPLISSGIFGFPKDLAKDIAVKAINRAIEGTDMDVRLIIR